METIKDQITGENLFYAKRLENNYFIYNDFTFETHCIVRKIGDKFSHCVALKTDKLNSAIQYYNTYIKH